MAAKDGSKTGGRKVGVPNKRTQEAQAIFDEFEFDPIRKAVKRLKDAETTMEDELFLNTCLKLAKFCYSEMKSVEHKFDPTKLNSKELLEEAEFLMGEIKANE